MSKEDYCRKWQLTDPVPLTETATSKIFTVTRGNGDRAVLKILTPLGREDEKAGGIALRHFDGNGAVRIFDMDDDAQLMEYAPGDSLKSLCRDGQDRQAAHIAGDILNRLHSVPVTAHARLIPLRQRFASLLDLPAKTGLFAEAADIAGTLLASPLNQAVLHGDLHHDNIRHSPRGWLAFDPKGIIGETTFDAANMLCNPLDMDGLVLDENRLMANAQVLANSLMVPTARLLAFTFAYAALSACWSQEDGDPRLAIKTAEMAARLI